MKIAFIVGKFPSLYETFILTQITGLIDMGHEVETFSLGKSEDKKIHFGFKKYNLSKRFLKAIR